MSELFHFAHGNGFPSRCYLQLLEELGKDHNYCYIDKIGHHNFPVTENWSFLVEEVLASIQQHASKPVIALGHSLGGILSLLAAIKKPSLFKGLILIDAPLIGRFKSNLVRIAKVLGLIDKITPASRTQGRREHWKNKTQVLRYLKQRELFKTFHPACLQDYIEYGLKKIDSGYTLAFNRHIEYLIYCTMPHHLHELKGKLVVPTALIYGDQSNVIKQADVSYMRKQYNILGIKMQGSHMLPLEHPYEVAKQILNLLDTFFDEGTIT